MNLSRRALFQPKRLDDLRAEALPAVGRVFDFVHAGTGGDDEPYPGQTRWSTEDRALGGQWVPDEDLEDEVPA